MRVKTLEDAMNLINDHGNGTCIFTRWRERSAAGAGCVAFVWWVESLFGDLHAYGPDAVRFYTKRKTIRPSAGVREGAIFSFPSTK
jgi:malonate-semialdehyde dehydrogenase (acetylating)/methylmalonate-semialdehyde dehydrogenase